MPPPRKKDRLRAVCPQRENIFRPQRRSAAGSQICRAKAAQTRAQKQPRRGPGAVRRLRPWESGGHRVRGGAGKRPPGLPARAEGMPGRKTAPGGGRELCAGCAHGRAADIMCGVVSGRHRTGHPVGQRARPGAKTAPAEAGDCAQAAPTGKRQAMGVSGTGKHHTGHPPGQRARPGAKTAPGGAGGCLDAGYGGYLPRAIRVIWMHRVGSTARPRIMPS